MTFENGNGDDGKHYWLTPADLRALAAAWEADRAELARLRAEAALARSALTALYEACVLADDSGDLPSTIGGELLDKARAALAGQPADAEPAAKEGER